MLPRNDVHDLRQLVVAGDVRRVQVETVRCPCALPWQLAAVAGGAAGLAAGAAAAGALRDGTGSRGACCALGELAGVDARLQLVRARCMRARPVRAAAGSCGWPGAARAAAARAARPCDPSAHVHGAHAQPPVLARQVLAAAAARRRRGRVPGAGAALGRGRRPRASSLPLARRCLRSAIHPLTGLSSPVRPLYCSNAGSARAGSPRYRSRARRGCARPAHTADRPDGLVVGIRRVLELAPHSQRHAQFCPRHRVACLALHGGLAATPRISPDRRACDTGCQGSPAGRRTPGTAGRSAGIPSSASSSLPARMRPPRG